MKKITEAGEPIVELAEDVVLNVDEDFALAELCEDDAIDAVVAELCEDEDDVIEVDDDVVVAELYEDGEDGVESCEAVDYDAEMQRLADEEREEEDRRRQQFKDEMQTAVCIGIAASFL